jgi:uncharacterized membrane protein YgaE (UPF0421/DUF939 family)
MKLDRAYMVFINLSARLFGAMALLVGIYAFACAYVFKEDRWLYGIVGIFAIAVGVAVFMAKPITNAQVSRIRRRMSRPE